MGTAGYMAPEQVRGVEVDHRADIFSFGVVLYEMVAGRHPFRRESGIETMNAILREDAPPIADVAVPPAMVRIIEYAMEKAPSNRFDSVRDIAFALGTLTLSGEVPSRGRRARKAVVEAKPKEVTYERITFRRGFIMSARFAPDGTIVYGAAWEDKPIEIFASHRAIPEPQPLGANADVLSIAPSGELALSIGRHYYGGWRSRGVLARRPFGGGAPRPVLEDVQEAEWTRDGKDFLVVRMVNGMSRIELPIGNVLYEAPFWISHARQSPRGDLIAFIEHPLWGDDAGSAVIVDRQGNERARSSRWHSTGGLAWLPKGDEIWIAAEAVGRGRDIVSLTLSGRERVILPTPGRFTLHDIDKDGNALIAFENGRREAVAGTVRDGLERNLSWFDWSWISDVSDDGKLLLLVEQASAVRGRNTVYVRPTDGGAAIRIGEAHARGRAMSRDGKWIVIETALPTALELVPVGAGATRRLPTPKLETVLAWQPFPDRKRLLLLGHNRPQPLGIYEMPFDGDGSVRSLSETRASWPILLSNDGNTVASIGPDEKIFVYPIGGEARCLPGSSSGDTPIGWTQDDRALYVQRSGRVAVRIDRVDVATGEASHFHTIAPCDPAGILDINPCYVTPDGQTYAYSFRRFLSDLYVVSGL